MSVHRNYVYNLIFQITSIITPFITIPYISRVLGSYGVGVAAFTNSIVQYFILFGTLGVALYGNRSIAYVRDDSKKLCKTFWEIFIFKLMITMLSFFIYIFLAIYIFTEHKVIYLIQSFNLIAAIIDITWLFYGLEQFGKVVSRNLIVKAISIALIFTLVKSPTDVWKYVAISAVGNVASQAVMWIYAAKFIGKPLINVKNSMRHFKPTLKLFIPQVAIQVYVVLDKTMLGLLAGEADVGVYSLSQRVIKMTLTVATSLGAVMLPRMANIFAKKDEKAMKDYLNKSFNFVSYLTFPMAFGLAGISSGFVSWFFGKDFSSASILMKVMSPIIIAIGWSNVFGVQLMLPMKKEKEFTISVTSGAAVNFFLNLVLIPRFGSLGAAVGTLAAEFTVTSVQMFLLRNMLRKELFNEVWKYGIGSLAILVAILPVYKMLSGVILSAAQIVIGVAVYALTMHVAKSSIHKTILNKIQQSFGRRFQ